MARQSDRFVKIYSQGSFTTLQIWVDRETGGELPVAVQRLRRRADAPLKARRHPRRDAASPRIRQITDMPPPFWVGALDRQQAQWDN